jgi:class 3 adenylate cyclase
LIPAYDIYKQTGYPSSMVIPNMDVASQITVDVIKTGKFLAFVQALVSAQDDGIMGRRYQISFLREIIRGTYDLGFVFDTANNMFVENPSFRKTKNWGALEEGVEYLLVFLDIDIVGNSRLVRSHSQDEIQKSYKDLRSIVSQSIDKRNGRIWNWEGDGGLVAFFFGDKHTAAVLSAMEIINELFIYNRTSRVLKEPLSVRIGIHGGSCEYSSNKEQLDELEAIKETQEIEKAASPDSVCISVVVKVMLDEFISVYFPQVGNKKNGPFKYTLKLE